MGKKIVPVVLKKSGNNRQISPSLNWVFTCNNYTQKKIDMIVLDSSIKRYSFQEEIGELGTPHLQGYVEFKVKTRPCPRLVDFGARWAKVCPKVIAQKNGCRAAIEYTQKIETRAPGGKLYVKGIKKIRPLKILSNEQLYPWQKEIVNMVEEIPDDRMIHWYWEPHGCAGKTQLCKYLVVNHGAIVIGGTKGDMYYSIVNAKNTPDLVIVNLPNDSCMPDIKGLEAIKDGLFASTKYECSMFIMNSPHVIVFANMEPIFEDNDYDYSKRWVVTRL